MLVAAYIFPLLHVINFWISEVDGIGCYVCKSINGSDPKCEDPFNSYPEVYESSCFAAKGGDVTGTFPATTCLKLQAAKGNYTVFIRDCTLDHGGTTKDVEIGALDHCGWIRSIEYDHTSMSGCLTTCDNDGCNGGNEITLKSLVALLAAVLFLVHIN